MSASLTNPSESLSASSSVLHVRSRNVQFSAAMAAGEGGWWIEGAIVLFCGVRGGCSVILWSEGAIVLFCRNPSPGLLFQGLLVPSFKHVGRVQNVMVEWLIHAHT